VLGCRCVAKMTNIEAGVMERTCERILQQSINNIINSYVQFTTVDVHLQTADTWVDQ